MAISVDPLTHIITVPKADLTLVQASPEVRELDLDDFRMWLKDWEDDEEGIVQPKTHNHNTEITLSGLNYARTIEVLSPYTVEFEDAQYSINCTGANHNLADVKVVNQVSLIVNNAAGLISSPDIEYASFQSGVWVDFVTGDDSNKGNEQSPVQTIDRALVVASYRGFKKLYAQSNITIGAGHNFDDFIIQGQSHVITQLTIEAGASCERLTIDNCNVTGVLDGNNEVRNCVAGDIVYFNGHIHNCGLYGMFYLDGAANAVIADCSTIDADNPPIIDMGGSGQSLAMPNYSGLITIQNLDSATEEVGIGLNAGMVTIDSTVVDGNLIIAGTGILTHTQTASENVNSDGLMSKNTIGVAVWDEPVSTHLVPGSTGLVLGIGQFNGRVSVSSTGNAGTEFPLGTERVPVDNIPDAVLIAVARGLSILHFDSDFTIPSTTSIVGYHLEGDGMQDTVLTCELGSIMAYCSFKSCTVIGETIGVIGFYDSLLYEVGSSSPVPSDKTSIAKDSIFQGVLGMPSNFTGKLYAIDCVGVPLLGEPPTIDMDGGTFDIEVRNYSGFIKVMNCPGESDIRIMLNSGGVELDSSVTAGNFIISGVGTFVDNSTGVTSLDTASLISEAGIGIAVWDEPIANHLLPDTMGHQMYHQAYAGIVHVNAITGAVGTTFPTGTSHEPCSNLSDALVIANTHFINTIHFEGAYEIDHIEDLAGITLAADRSLGNELTITSMVNSDACYFQNLTVSGALVGSTRFTECVLGDLTGFDGGAKDSLVTDSIVVTGLGANYLTNCDTYSTDDTVFKSISVGDHNLNLIRCEGNYEIADKTGTQAIVVSMISGDVKIASSCVAGSIHIEGISEIVDESGAGCTVDVEALSSDNITNSVWEYDRDA